MGFPGTGYSRPPRGRHDLQSIFEGIELTAKNWPLFVAYTVLAGVIACVLDFIWMAVTTGIRRVFPDEVPELITDILLFVPDNFVFYTTAAAFMAGGYTMARNAISNEPVSVEVGFSGLGWTWRLLGVSILISILFIPITVLNHVLLGVGLFDFVALARSGNMEQQALGRIGGYSVAFLVLGTITLYLTGRFMLARPAVVLEGMAPVDAMRRAWQLSASCHWRIMLWLTVIQLLAGLAGCLCFLLIFFVIPAVIVAETVLYRDLSGLWLGGMQHQASPYPRAAGAPMPPGPTPPGPTSPGTRRPLNPIILPNQAPLPGQQIPPSNGNP